jgi:hypothetical protein
MEYDDENDVSSFLSDNGLDWGSMGEESAQQWANDFTWQQPDLATEAVGGPFSDGRGFRSSMLVCKRHSFFFTEALTRQMLRKASVIFRGCLQSCGSRKRCRGQQCCAG